MANTTAWGRVPRLCLLVMGHWGGCRDPTQLLSRGTRWDRALWVEVVVFHFLFPCFFGDPKHTAPSLPLLVNHLGDGNSCIIDVVPPHRDPMVRLDKGLCHPTGW